MILRSAEDEPLNDVALVVVTYNAAADIAGFTTSLEKGLDGVERSEVVFVDNASNDTTLREISRAAPSATVVASPHNGGFAAGLNLGFAAAAPARAVFVLNPDIRLGAGCVRSLLETLDAPGVGIAAPRILDGDGAVYPSLRREPTLARALGVAVLGGRRAGRVAPLGEVITAPKAYESERSAAWATGAALLVSTECWRAVGGWDESFFLFSEETDFALRAGDLGYALRYDPAAVATHIGGVSMSTDPTMYALLASNRLRLYSKRHPARTSVYRWTVALHEAVRSLRGSPTHRAALSAVLSLDPAEPAGSRAETERVPAVPAQPGRPA